MTDEVVVVAIDGSPASYTALRWALMHAATTGSRVHAIRCWQPMSVWEAMIIVQPVPPLAEQRARIEHELSQIVDAALARVSDRNLADRVRCKVVRGRAGPVLVAETGRAALLVLGSHNQQRVAALARRSVSRYCTRLAPCPVVVIPPAIGLRGMPTDAREVKVRA